MLLLNEPFTPATLMPIFLKRIDDDTLGVTMAKLSKPEFGDALARIKSIPGRRWNPTSKVNEFPADADTAMRIMRMLAPVADAEVQAMVQNHQAEVAEAILTRIPDQADLGARWEPLYGFQRAYIAWAQDHPRHILADEMGLGKTVECLAVLAVARERSWDITQHEGTPEHQQYSALQAPALAVAPKAVAGVWASEAEKGPLLDKGTPQERPLLEDWPGMEVQVIDGRTPAKRRQQAGRDDVDLFIVNWEKLQTRVKLVPYLAERDWSAIFASEAHRAKNRKAQQTKGLLKLHAPIQIAETGSPIMASPDDLYPLLKWLRPEQYTSFWNFHYAYVDEYTTAYNQRVMTGVKNVDALRFELSDKLIRRRKTDVLKDLPPKLPPQVIDVPLSVGERKVYLEAERAFWLDVATYAAEHPELAESIESLNLQQIEGMIKNAGARLAKMRQLTAAAKINFAEELIRDAAEPIVAFTWHVEPARELARRLSAGGERRKVGTIAGDDDAQPVVDKFMAGDLDHVVCTIAKGGVGLTLTRSSHALMIEEDYVAEINKQAVDRLHRHGQTLPVNTTILRVPDTVDTDTVAPSARFKQQITTQVLGDLA